MFLPELVKLITTSFFFRLADDIQASESDAFSVTRKPRTMMFLISPRTAKMSFLSNILFGWVTSHARSVLPRSTRSLIHSSPTPA